MMREIKLEDINPVVAIKERIRPIFEILRREGIPSEDYYVILFLLSIYNEGIISDEVLSENTYQKDTLFRSIHRADYEYPHQYIPVFHSFEPALNQLSESGLAEILQVFAGINKNVLSENFPDIFDSVLYRITESQGRFGGEFIQPVELTRFICRLVDLPSISKVFNPFAGLASFGVYLDQGHEYFGQELNRKTWALGALRIMAYKRIGKSRYVCGDSITNWPDPSEKFDLIVSNPPYGLRFHNQHKGSELGIRSVEQFLIDNGVQSLNAEGKLIVLMPQGFLFRGGYEQRLRKYLVENDLLDTIISFPGGLLLNTGIPLIILVINKAKKRVGKVRFIDATKYVEVKSPRVKVLNDYKLNSIVRGNKEDNEAVRIVDVGQIRELDYNLNVSRYFQKEYEGVKLREILEFVRGGRVNIPQSGKLVRIGDLKNDKVDFKLDVPSIKEIEFRRTGTHLIDESCLLLAGRWKSLKPTFFEFAGEPVFIGQDILSFKVNESLADVSYLINELHADYVLEQLDSYRFGASVMPFIRKEDLLEVKIKLPSLEEQRARVQGIEELLEKIKILKIERNNLAHARAYEHFNEFASLKHTLGRPRQNILDWADNLIDFFASKGAEVEKLNKSFADYYEVDIISALKEIKRDVNYMSVILEKGERGLVLSDHALSLVSLADINALVKGITSNGFSFQLKKFLIEGEMLKERGIECNISLLKALLDNILTNADKYAFSKREITNEVVIELTEVEDVLVLEVKNNGKPFPRGYDKEKFVSKFSTANPEKGSGLGGYDINRIAEYFNNSDWSLSLNEDPI